jgi:hypothetical protein
MPFVPEISSNDDFLVAKVVSFAYNPLDFDFHDLQFSELPQPTREFLTDTTNLYPRFPASCGPVYFDDILHIRKARAAQLKRVLEGVNRRIANDMIVSTHHSDEGAKNASKAEVDKVLIPQWRRHLDDYVLEIDALVWFEVHAQRGTPNPLSLKQALSDREEDVARIIEFALQLLQMAYERRKREARGEALMAGIVDSMGDELDGVLGCIAQQDCVGDSGTVLQSPN